MRQKGTLGSAACRIKSEIRDLDAIVRVSNNGMRRNLLPMAKSAWKSQMRFVQAIERLTLKRDLVNLGETERGTKQTNADDAVAPI